MEYQKGEIKASGLVEPLVLIKLVCDKALTLAFMTRPLMSRKALIGQLCDVLHLYGSYCV